MRRNAATFFGSCNHRGLRIYIQINGAIDPVSGDMQTVRLMIYDFDGTLVTSGRDIATSVNLALRSAGIRELDEARIIGFVGDGAKKLIERSLGDDHRQRFGAVYEAFQRHYRDHMLDTTGLYPGVKDILEHFRDKRKVILTNKNHEFAARMAAALGIDAYFDDIIGGDSTPYVKPDRRLVEPLAEKYGAAPRDIVVIGDGPNDILLARNAGALSCAFMKGLVRKERLLPLGPDFVYEDITELKNWFD